MKTNTILRNKGRNRPEKGKPMAEKEETETVMMCWGGFKDSPKKQPHTESEKRRENCPKDTKTKR